MCAARTAQSRVSDRCWLVAHVQLVSAPSARRRNTYPIQQTGRRLCLLLVKRTCVYLGATTDCRLHRRRRRRHRRQFGEHKKTKTTTKRKTTHRHISTLWDHPHASAEIASLPLMITNDDDDDGGDDEDENDVVVDDDRAAATSTLAAEIDAARLQA